MSTEVNNETGVAIDAAEFAALADHVLRVMHVNPRAELSILFIDPEPMAELHERWLDLPGPTDVMSFPMDELRPGTPDHESMARPSSGMPPPRRTPFPCLPPEPSPPRTPDGSGPRRP